MEDQNQQPMGVPQEPIQAAGSSNSLFSKPILLGIVAAVILVIILVGVFTKTMYSPKNTYKATTMPSSYATPTPTIAAEQPTISSSEGLNSALQNVDSQNSSFDTDVLQNSQDASTFQ